MKFKDKLIELRACEEAIEWVGDRTLEEAWAECERGDWLLWLYQKLYPDNLRELTLAKGHCANTVRHLMQDERSRKAVDVAIAFGEGKATREGLDNAYAASYAAYYDYTSYAAYASALAATNAANAAANAADDSAYEAANAADAKKQNQKQTADICRKYLKINNSD